MFRKSLSTALALGLATAAGCASTDDKNDLSKSRVVKTTKTSESAINSNDAELLTIQQSTQKMANPIVLTADAFQNGESIPHRNSDYGEKVSPALRWTGVPAGTMSLVILCEDPDAKMPKPFIHWVMYNVPPMLTELREAIPGSPRLPTMDGTLQGTNSRGSTGYIGPRPPAKDGPHHYHFQVFALDKKIDSLLPAADRKNVADAMKGHVLAQGELIGTFDASQYVQAMPTR